MVADKSVMKKPIPKKQIVIKKLKRADILITNWKFTSYSHLIHILYSQTSINPIPIPNLNLLSFINHTILYLTFLYSIKTNTHHSQYPMLFSTYPSIHILHFISINHFISLTYPNLTYSNTSLPSNIQSIIFQ